MKKHDVQGKLLLSISVVAFIAVTIFTGIRYFSHLQKIEIHPNNLVEFIILASMLLVTLTLTIISTIVYVIRMRKTVFLYAYHDMNLGIYNESYFVQNVSLKRKKRTNGKKGFIAIFDIEENADFVMRNSENQKFLYRVREKISECLIHMKEEKKLESYGYQLSRGFFLYMECKTKEQAIEVLCQLDDQIHELNEKDYVLKYGVYEDVDVSKSMEECFDCCELALASDSIAIAKEIRIYSDKMTQEALEQISYAKEIEHALENEEFEIYYEPKFDLKKNRFVGAEALIRWNHPTKGLLFPGAIIPFAEKNGQINQIDEYVFRHVCKDIALWKAKGEKLVTISVNLSRNSVYNAHLIDMMKKTIEETNISPLLLEIEITESAYSKDIYYVLSVVKKIRALNVRIAMDDFGTGYSSLSCLRRFPVDTLKIDKSFFDNLEIDKKTREIVKATISLAKELELYVVAEGIETQKQLDILMSSSCDCVQGHYFSKALSRDDFASFLKNNSFERRR